jgi:hypothetical protein
MPLELKGTQYKPLNDALRLRLYPDDFDRMLKQRLDIDRYNLTLAGNFQQRVHEVIDAANKQGWVYRLVIAAREEAPMEPAFVEYARLLRVAPEGTPDANQLESIIQVTNAQLDIAMFRSRLGQVEAQVCRVDLDGDGRGTGFLVGPSTVMTNYHVVEKVVKGEKKATALSCKFDFKVREDGTEINEGRDIGVTEIIGSSPYDPSDLQPNGGAPDAEKLDYALLHLEGEPGNQPLGDEGKEFRKWVELPTTVPQFKPNGPLFIVQHPRKRPLKLALDTKSILGVVRGDQRVRYQTNTEDGSSGSPCFDPEWKLVALHHSGDPNWMPTWNEGIPINLIVTHARKCGWLA